MQRKTSTVNTAFTVSEIVRTNYRTADVFKSLGINYCCSGQVSLQEACQIRGLNLPEVAAALDAASAFMPLSNTIQFANWKPEFLIDYLVNIHHAYLYQTLPGLEAAFTTFTESHKNKFPELLPVLRLFRQLAHLLTTHNQKEEATVFPYLKQLINAYNRKETYGSLFVKTMRLPLEQVLGKDHMDIADLVMQLRKASNNYGPPEKSCTNYIVMMNKLAELDNDLVQHKHLENNILFPKVLDMEKELLQL